MYKPFVSAISALAAGAIYLLSPAAASADNVSFNYQGRVKVQGQPFTGTGQFKFAVLNTAGSSVLWSNDGTVGTGTDPSTAPAPAASVALPVNDGVFSVMVGDPAVPGMAPLDNAVMVSQTPLKLRVWFSDGSLGFQQLTPDHNLVDLTLNTIQTGNSDYTIYVDTAAGNDSNNGLSQAQAKKTIGAAVDIIPQRIKCNVTVKIMPGIYREAVGVSNISVAPGKQLSFVGDETWVGGVSGSPNVRISGATDDAATNRVIEDVFSIDFCTRIKLRGLQFEGASKRGINVEQSRVMLQHCKATNSALGMAFSLGSFADLINCVATNCDVIGNTNPDGIGFHFSNGSGGFCYNLVSTNNTFGGMRINTGASVNLYDSCEVSGNGISGIYLYDFAAVHALGQSGAMKVHSNGHQNLQAARQSHVGGPWTFTGTAPTYGNIVLDPTSFSF